MSDEIRMTITLPTDDEGMVGRECPECKEYFKLKLGTGLPDLETCTCPYCEHTDDSGEFITQAQLEYAQSIAVREVLGPSLAQLERSFKQLERTTRHSSFSIKVSTGGFNLPVKYYAEKDLETIVECDSCGLVFSIYGVFAVCPDCSRPITMSMFKKALEVSRKRFGVLKRIPNEESELREALLIDTVSGGVATFDSLGKRLREEFPTIFPQRPRNLFQNLDALCRALEENMSIQLKDLVGEEKYSRLYYLFQVRHIWIHNFGEADESFIRTTNCDPSLLGTKVIPSQDEVAEFLGLIENVATQLREKLQ
jgi:Zn ribbon nucleic-acid-binding protein